MKCGQPSNEILLMILKFCSFHRMYLHTAISRKVVGRNVHVTILKGNMGYDQYTIPDFVAVKPTFVVFL